MTLSFTGRIEDAVPSGERPVYAEVFRTFSHRVVGLCRHMLRDRNLTEDAASEVFLKLHSALETYDGSIPLERWLLRIAANHCIDLMRRQQLERRWI
jgi:RNA polymerase sigma-70 factor, ECF subfamily